MEKDQHSFVFHDIGLSRLSHNHRIRKKKLYYSRKNTDLPETDLGSDHLIFMGGGGGGGVEDFLKKKKKKKKHFQDRILPEINI